MTCQEVHPWAIGGWRRVQRRPSAVSDPACPVMGMPERRLGSGGKPARLPGRGHQLGGPVELAGEHRSHLMPLPLHSGGSLLAEHRAQNGGVHLLLRPGHGLKDVVGKVQAAALPASALDHAAHQPDTSQTALFEAGQELSPEGHIAVMTVNKGRSARLAQPGGQAAAVDQGAAMQLG